MVDARIASTRNPALNEFQSSLIGILLPEIE